MPASRPKLMPFPSPAPMKSIRHPVLWRFFSDLDVPNQHACLNGNSDGLDQLACAYLTWFRRKAERRIGGLVRDACLTALEAVAEHFRNNPAGVGEKVRDWVEPCIGAGCNRLHAEQIFGEAMTTGLLVGAERLGRRWRWKHPWFCEYLCRMGANE